MYHRRGGVQGYVHPSCFSCIRQVVCDITAVNLHIMVSMAAFTVRNLSDVTLRALRRRAAKHGRSTEAEVRAILDAAARPDDRLKIGSALTQLFQPLGGMDIDIERDRTPAKPISFE